MWREISVCFVILCVCDKVAALTVDSQFGTSTEDCFERFLIGWRLPERAIYRNATELTARECEKLCRRDKQCRSYDYGVGAKGNATCNLSDVTEKDITENKIAQKNIDYDIHIRRFRCEQPPPKPLKPNFDDLIDDPEQKPSVDLNDEQSPSELPSKPQDQKPSPNINAYHFRPPHNYDYTNHRPNHKPNYHNDNDRPDAPYPDILEPDLNIGYGPHKPFDTPFRPSYHNHTKPKPDPYDVLHFQHHYRPSTIYYSENLRPDPPYLGDIEDNDSYGHKPTIDHHYKPEKPLYPDQNYYHKPILPPITHLPEYFPSSKPGNKPGYEPGYKPNWDSHGSSYDQKPEVPSYGSNITPMRPSYGGHSPNNGGSHYIYLEINETPKPFQKPTYPHASDNHYTKPNTGYQNYQPSNTHKPWQSYYGQSYGEDNYYKPSYTETNYNRPSYENYNKPSYVDSGYNKPNHEKPSHIKPSYGESNNNDYPTPIKPSYNQPSYTDSGYNKPSYEKPSNNKPGYGESSNNEYPTPIKPSYNQPSYTDSGYNKPSYEKPSYNKPAYGESSNNEYPAPIKPSYNQPSYTDSGYNKPSYEKPSYNKPVYGESSNNEYPTPIKPSYNQPSYTDSGYNKPSYEKPSYAKPSNNKPSYGDTNDNEFGYNKPTYNYERPSHYSPFQIYDNYYDSHHQESSSSYGFDKDKWHYQQKPTYSYNKPENYGYGYNHNYPEDNNYNYESVYDKYNNYNGYKNHTGYGYVDKPSYGEKPSYGHKPDYSYKPSNSYRPDSEKPDNTIKPVYEKDPYRPASAPSYTIKPSGHVISSGAISIVNQGGYGNKPGYVDRGSVTSRYEMNLFPRCNNSWPH